MPKFALFQSDRASETARFGVFVVLIAACFLMGGSSRIDILSLIVLQPLAVACAAGFVLIPGFIDWERVRWPLLLLCALSLLMVAQLVPLPPQIWSALPGHADYARALAQEGIAIGWRPLSMTPDNTLAGLAGLVVPAAVLIGVAALPGERVRQILPVLIGFIVLGMLLALLQVTGGEGSPFFTYQITNRGSPVGLMANRNHQALLLSAALPMIALWAGQTARDPILQKVRYGVGVALVLLILPLIAATGSRAGLLLGLIGLSFAWFQVRGDLVAAGRANKAGQWLARLLALIPVVLGLGTVAVVFLLSRSEAIERLLGSDIAQDMRAQAFPVVRQMTEDFFPTGAGFGTFDPTFRAYEPAAMLGTTYLNHAHNDLLETVFEGGIPALLLLLVSLGWLAAKGVTAVRAPITDRRTPFARLGLAMMLLPLASSLVDYPLRTPLWAALFALGCAWLGQARATEKPSSAGPLQSSKGLYRSPNPV